MDGDDSEKNMLSHLAATRHIEVIGFELSLLKFTWAIKWLLF